MHTIKRNTYSHKTIPKFNEGIQVIIKNIKFDKLLQSLMNIIIRVIMKHI